MTTSITPARPASDPLSRALLTCGLLAGPVFTLAWIVEGATRPTYDALRHPISSLSIGELGWTQATNFIVTGILTLAFAWGLWRRFKKPGGSLWGPLLAVLIAVGFFGAGFFVTDAMSGYPVGTPPLIAEPTATGRLHRLFSALVFIGLPGACFVFARWFARRGSRGWSTYSTFTGFAFIALFVVTSVGFAQVAGLVEIAGLFQRITLTVGWAWIFLLALHLIRNQDVGA